MTEVPSIETSVLIYYANYWNGLFMIRTFAIKELGRSSFIILRKSILTCCKAELAFLFFFFFFLSGFVAPLYYFHPLHRHLEISKVIAAESSPLHIAGNGTRSRKFGFSIVIWLSTKLRAL